jgi:serine/arginine repetitive matrix protein 1
MSCQGFYRGTSHDQVPFFANKEKKMIETKKWPDEFEKEVDMSKVNVSVISSWITKRITEILGFEDEIIIDYCRQQLLPQTSTDIGSLSAEKICPKKLQINMTGFLAKNASSFVKDLWSLLLDAQESESGIPSQFVEEQKNEMMFKQAEAQRIKEALEKVHKVKNSQNVLQESEQNNNETNSKTTSEAPLNEGIDDKRLFY